MASSTLLPNTQRNSMLPARCSRPPCRNIDVTMVSAGGSCADPASTDPAPVSIAGTTPNTLLADCAPSADSHRCCHTYTSAQAIMMPAVTYGLVALGLSS